MASPDDFPPPPRRPDEAECCGQGCDPCIFDYYERALDRWRGRVEAMGADPDALMAARDAQSERGDASG